MEYIVEATIPSATPETLLEGLFEELELTGEAAEVLFGECDGGAVHISFQIDAENDRQATFEVAKMLSPVLTALEAEATAAEYDVYTPEECDRKHASRWTFNLGVGRSMAMAAGVAGAAAFLVLHGPHLLGDKPGMSMLWLADVIGLM